LNTILKHIKKFPELLVLSFLFIFRIVYFFSLTYTLTPDSYEYIAVDGFAWLQGSVDRYRLPVYSMLIDICQFISKNHFAFIVCLIQLFASLLSILVLFLTIKKVTCKKWIALVLTFIYSTLGAVSGWDKTLLTESLSLSLTIFILYGIISYIKDRKYTSVVLTAICLLIGCFLKAIFVLYAGLFFGFLILISIFPGKNDGQVDKRFRIKNLKSTLISIVPIILVFAYAISFSRTYGGFTLSDSSLGQQLFVVLDNGYYKSSSDEEIKNVAESIMSTTANSAIEKKYDEFVADFYKDSDVSEKDILELKNKMLSLVDNTLDQELENRLDEYISAEYQNDFNSSYTNPVYLARIYIMESYDRDRVVQFVSEAKNKNFVSYFLKKPLNLNDIFSSYNDRNSSTIAYIIVNFVDKLLHVFRFSLLHSLIVSAVELISYLVILIKKKRSDWIRLGLGTYILVTIFLSIFGTSSEFARTAITSLPFMFVSFAVWANLISEYAVNKIEQKQATK